MKRIWITFVVVIGFVSAQNFSIIMDNNFSIDGEIDLVDDSGNFVADRTGTMDYSGYDNDNNQISGTGGSLWIAFRQESDSLGCLYFLMIYEEGYTSDPNYLNDLFISVFGAKVNGTTVNAKSDDFAWIIENDSHKGFELCVKGVPVNENLVITVDATMVWNGIHGISSNFYWETKINFTLEVERIDGIPSEWKLGNNYPNPSNPNTTIEFILPVGSSVKLNIYNLLGERIVTIYDNYAQPGNYAAKWDGTDEYGIQVPSGVYLFELDAGQYFHDVKAMTLLK
jgi:hypothetical protein